MKEPKDLSNKVFGKLTVLSFNSSKNGRRFWNCHCECGNDKIIREDALKSKGGTKSCGCLAIINLRRGINHYNYNPNMSDEERKLSKARHHSLEMKKWRKDVLQRDSYTCQISGVKGQIVSHHLNSWNKFPEQRFDIDNGITILTILHRLFHKLYGNGNNTKEQFLEFKERYNNKEFTQYLENYTVNKKNKEKLRKQGNQHTANINNLNKKFIGVRKIGNKWESRIKKDKILYFNYFKTELEAVDFYDKFALYLYGEDATINLTHDREKYLSSNLEDFFNKYKKFFPRKESSSYNGVGLHKSSGKWAATIIVNNKKIHIGLFDREIDAAKAYDNFSLKIFGINNKINFK